MSNGAPYLLALIFGLLVSATVYLVWVWPLRAPSDDDEATGDDEASD